MVGHPDEIIVSAEHPDNPLGPTGRWQPKGRQLGKYVFVLNLKSEKVSLMAWDQFLQLEIVNEFFDTEYFAAYPELNYGAEPDGIGINSSAKT